MTEAMARLLQPSEGRREYMTLVNAALGHRAPGILQPRRLHFMLVLCALSCEAKDPPAHPGRATVADTAPDTASTSPPASGARALRVDVGRSPEHGLYLADSNGRALYVLAQDSGGTTSCYDACARVWPPLLATGRVPTAAASAVKQALLSTIARRDGEIQVTYDGHGLYYYQGDDGPGQTNGHHVQYTWGEWYLMSPEGLNTHQSPERQPPR